MGISRTAACDCTWVPADCGLGLSSRRESRWWSNWVILHPLSSPPNPRVHLTEALSGGPVTFLYPNVILFPYTTTSLACRQSAASTYSLSSLFDFYTFYSTHVYSYHAGFFLQWFLRFLFFNTKVQPLRIAESISDLSLYWCPHLTLGFSAFVIYTSTYRHNTFLDHICITTFPRSETLSSPPLHLTNSHFSFSFLLRGHYFGHMHLLLCLF